jgi:MFS family permease
MGLLALTLGLLVITHEVQIWQVYALAFLLGVNNTFENPARQSFILELVGAKDLRNAVSLNSVMVNVARAVGPAVAGVIITAGGLGVCFLINAVSFIAVVTSLATLDVSKLQPSPPSGRAKGQLREGLRYVRSTPRLAISLTMMAVVGCLAYEFQVVLPVLARKTFHGNAEVYGAMTAAMGVGAILGGLVVAARGRTGVLAIVKSSALFGLAILAGALAPNLTVELIALLFVGATSIAVMTQANSTLQLEASPSMRGRVMALWAVAFLGSTPIGGPIAGFVSEQYGGRAGLLLGAAACFVAAAYGSWAVRRVRRQRRAEWSLLR